MAGRTPREGPPASLPLRVSAEPLQLPPPVVPLGWGWAGLVWAGCSDLAMHWGSTSEGCQDTWGRAWAKWAACCPDPEATSSTCSPAWLWLRYCLSTLRMGSLFLSAAAATIILGQGRHQHQLQQLQGKGWLAGWQEAGGGRGTPGRFSPSLQAKDYTSHNAMPQEVPAARHSCACLIRKEGGHTLRMCTYLLLGECVQDCSQVLCMLTPSMCAYFQDVYLFPGCLHTYS